MILYWNSLFFLLLTIVQATKNYDATINYSEDIARDHHDWSYEGENGPSNWGRNYPECNNKSQSPIVIGASTYIPAKGLKYIGYDDERRNMVLVNNGHTVQLNLAEDDQNPPYIVDDDLEAGVKYFLKQIHFHWGTHDHEGCEHILTSNKERAMEMHMVHVNPEAAQNGNAGIAVLAVVFKTQLECNCDYNLITNALKAIKYKDQTRVLNDNVTISTFFPKMLQKYYYYRYSGSLTTPPCTEGVIWRVFGLGRSIGYQQMELFRGVMRTSEGEEEKRMAPNYRPTQQLNGRSIFKMLQRN